MANIARLEGTWSYPRLRLSYPRFAPGPPTPEGKRQTMLEWVKALPGRFFDPETKTWIVDGLGEDPYGELERAGFELDTSEFGEGDIDLLELVDPLAKISKADPATTLVRPRLLGYEGTEAVLGPAAIWDKKRRRFEVRTTDIVNAKGRVIGGIIMSPEDIKRAAARHVHVEVDPQREAQATAIASLTSAPDDVGDLDDVPEWFGLNLFGYQHSGAVAAAAGRRSLFDPPGLGKTRQALAAAAINDPDRVLIVTPPVALTQWQREATASQVAAPDRYSNTRQLGATNLVEPGEHVAMIITGRKQPPLPDQGIVIVSDALLASRKQLADELIEWAPQVLIDDEVHRQKTWESARAKAVRRIAESIDGPRYAISGTPMFAHPIELASPLAITGQLDPIFGGFNSFVRRFCYKNHFGQMVARKKNLPELHKILKSQVWVRRRKKDVLKDLPDKSRYAKIVDVDLKEFRNAHNEVIETISEWVDDQMGPDGSYPGPAEIEAYSKDSIHLISRLRMGAGLAKIDVATEIIDEWLQANPADADGTYDRPLVVWTHHKVVTAAMREAAEQFGGAEVIDGSTSQSEKTRIVDAFQDGKVPVLVASITAAGVGITLTRSSDVYFVETDWTPALVSQAEDRCLRIGQTRPVSITTLVAPGTLDETIQRTLERKGKDLRVVMGDEEGDVAVAASGANPAARIVQDMVEQVIESKRRRAKRTRRAKVAA